MHVMDKGALQKKRCRKLLVGMVIAIVTGIVYAFFVQKTGWYVPCLFRLCTGYRCPGCGVSHLCVALLQGEWATAFAANQVLFLLLPMFLFLGLRLAGQYIREGELRLTGFQNGMLWVILIILILFGIIRNVVDI